MGFNPRTHVGCDQFKAMAFINFPCFNPRTHVGCDANTNANQQLKEFQSTHPRGVRPGHQQKNVPVQQVSIHAPTWGATITSITPRAKTTSFNPRTHVGCDLRCRTKSTNTLPVSIHAPTWGATPGFPFVPRKILCFNPRTHVGCDRGQAAEPRQENGFNPRTHVGCDP